MAYISKREKNQGKGAYKAYVIKGKCLTYYGSSLCLRKL